MNDFASLWGRYEPNDKAPWDLARVVHLHRRAGFAATWSEIQRDLKDGPKASIDRLLAGKAVTISPADRKGHANENLARELMELFTLGIGHYSETDVKEVARALTGWTVEDGAFAETAARHDQGEKTILGRKGKWTGSDVVRMLLEHP